MAKVTYEMIRKNKQVNALIKTGNDALGILGYTEHARIHAIIVAEVAARILGELGYSKREMELAKIAGYMHDIGNCVNRTDHAHNGAIMAFQILTELGMEPEEIAIVISAIGNHDERTGSAVNPVSAAIILADKTDVRRNRVRNKNMESFDMHDRVNYAVVKSKVYVNKKKSTIRLDMVLDETHCSVMDYFEIFLDRMLMCRRAAERLHLKFKLTANGGKVI